jgi:hypothetical protein
VSQFFLIRDSKEKEIEINFYDPTNRKFFAFTYSKTNKIVFLLILRFDLVFSNENKTSLACGIPAMPLFAKPTSSERFRLFGAQSDLRLWYENGTTIYYQCESAFRWITGDVDSRTCVNGKWVGKVGKCGMSYNELIQKRNTFRDLKFFSAINWGNKIRLYSIYTYDVDSHGKWVNQHYVMETNQTTHLDEHFAYRYRIHL